jgi:DNA-directed RNA polymerase subunit M
LNLIKKKFTIDGNRPNHLTNTLAEVNKMDFCEKCDALLVPQKMQGVVVAKCPDCNWIKENGKLATISITDDTRTKDPEGGKMLVLEENSNFVVGRPRKEMYCSSCESHQEIEYWEIQTRSADEAPTRFFRCTNCDKNWREYD